MVAVLSILETPTNWETIELIMVLVLIGGGSTASAVLCEGSGDIEDPCNSSGNHLLIAFHIHSETLGLLNLCRGQVATDDG